MRDDIKKLAQALNCACQSASTQEELLTAIQAILTTIDADTSAILTLEELENWTNIAGNSKEFTYYTDAGGGANPSGNNNVATVLYKTGVTTVLTQTFIYDINDNVLSITAS